MKTATLQQITQVDGFSPGISRLVSIMRYTRFETARVLNELSPQLSLLSFFLMHVSAVERWYQVSTFEKRNMTSQEFDEWLPALYIGERSRIVYAHMPILDAFEIMQSIREVTMRELALRDDVWLESTARYHGDRYANNYWKWFTVVEAEISCRAQLCVERDAALHSDLLPENRSI